MDSTVFQPHKLQRLILPPNFMNPLSSSSKFYLKPTSLFSKSLKFRFFCTTSHHVENTIEVIQAPNGKPSTKTSTILKINSRILKENWLSSLSINGINSNRNEGVEVNGGLQWVIGVDPDVSGALSLLKFDCNGIISAQVFDSPYVKVSVGKTCRKRLDARSIVQLLQSFDAPVGTTAYLEQSTPFPRDGKQGWWSGGFGYGLWIGVLVASRFSVVPVPSSLWKKEFDLARNTSTKDDSRELAARLFPDLSSMLKRKKDHGRAEALLIAAYGKGLKTKEKECCMPDETREVLDEL
ncbi:unnamed protein product [Amaranthus hypochondriacus]